jgi:hypothetical protein
LKEKFGETPLVHERKHLSLTFQVENKVMTCVSPKFDVSFDVMEFEIEI